MFPEKILSPLKLFWIFFLSLEWWATAGDRKECDRSGTKIPQIYVLVRSTKCCNLENDFISCLIYSDCETYIGGFLCGIKLITLSLILKESFLKHFFLSQLNHSFDGNNLITLFFSANLEELQDEERRETKNYEDQIEDLKAKCQERQEIVNQARYVKGKPLWNRRHFLYNLNIPIECWFSNTVCCHPPFTIGFYDGTIELVQM